MSQETGHIDSSGSEGLGNAQSAIMFSVAPLTSLSAMTPQVDPDPVASFRQLIALPPARVTFAYRLAQWLGVLETSA